METGDVALKQVVETYVHEKSTLVHIFAGGEEITATSEHPFYSPGQGWTAAAELQPGDVLLLLNGDYVIVDQVHQELLDTPVQVFNFQVQDFHTYFVADSGVLVHNRCGEKMRTDNQQALADLANEANKNAKSGNFISYDDAKILDEWAAEYKVPQHHRAYKGSGSHWKTGWDHTHIYNIHVPFLY